MQFRAATAADLEYFIRALETNRVREGRAPSEIPATPDDLAAFRAGIESGTIVVCESENSIAGFLFYRTDFPVLYVRGPIFWVDLIYVDEAHRRKGIGLLLYREVERLAREKGFSRIILDVFDENTESLAFHAKAGFRRIYGIFEKRVD